MAKRIFSWEKKFLLPLLTEKNYWAGNSYYEDLEVTIYGQ